MAATTVSDAPVTAKPRWYAPTPVKFLLAVLVMQGVFFLSAHYRWFWFNERKGYTVLITVAATTMALLTLVVAVIVSRFFKVRSQFSLATLLLIVPVMGIPCGWLGRAVATAREQQMAVDDLRSLGADVRYHDRKIDTSWTSRVLLPTLEDHLGQHFFTDVSSVSRSQATDDDLERVHGFTRLIALHLRNARLTDEGLKRLRGLTELRELSIQESVSIGAPGITDAGIRHLKNLRRIESLRLSGHGITDQALAQLQVFNRLGRLTILSGSVTDAGIANIADIQQLTTLELHGDRITDAGLENLKRLPHLSDLTLSSRSITDAGLESLHGLTQLERLTLLDTKVSNEGLGQLQDALPLCRVNRRGPER